MVKLVGKAIPAPGKTTASVVFLSLVALVTVAIVTGMATNEMRLVAAAVYLIFGFIVQRGSFCGAALLSKVILYREGRGLLAVGMAVFVAMIGIAVLDGQNVVDANPKPFMLLPAITGGLLFGVGMVLAGGCVSGSLFKATEGRVTSMVAVLGIMIGLAVASQSGVRDHIALLTNGVFLGTVPQLLGASYSSAGLVIGVVGVAAIVVFLLFSRKKTGAEAPLSIHKLVSHGWPVVTVGLLIGALGWLAYVAFVPLGRNYPLGSGEIPGTFLQLVFKGKAGPPGVVAWAFVVGSALSAWLSGQIILRSADRSTLVLAFVGGSLVGLGLIIGNGCFVGNMLSGWALLSTHSLLFGVVAILANWATTWVYLRGV